MAKLWCTIALSLGLYAFANLPWNEAILNNFLSETSCRKLVPLFFVLPWESVRLKQKIPLPGNHLPRVESGYSSEWWKKRRERESERGIFVAGRMEGRGDKAGLKVGPVTVANERIK